MTLATSVFELATILVGLGRLSGFPIGALYLRIVIDVGRPAKVLPIVSEDALVSLVVLFRHRAPGCLEVEHVKVRISLHLVKQRHGQLGLTVRKSTHVPVLASFYLVRVVRTKFGLVLLGVVELLNTVVALDALLLAVAARVALGNGGAQLTVVGSGGPPLVSGLGVVVEYAFLRVVCACNLARKCLEGH